jgi:hypothetical protein
MRMRKTLVTLLLLGGLVSEAVARPRFTRCCLVIPVEGVPDQPSCVQLRVPGRRIGPRRACRLIGGRPIGRGDCTLAACAVGRR